MYFMAMRILYIQLSFIYFIALGLLYIYAIYLAKFTLYLA